MSEPTMPPELVQVEPVTVSNGLTGDYPSPTTVKRLWSDGTTDLACSALHCNYNRPDAPKMVRAISVHYGRSHGHDTPRHFDVPFMDKHMRRPASKVSVTVDRASNGQCMDAIRRIVGSTGEDKLAAELTELRAARDALQDSYNQLVDNLDNLAAELIELRTWRDSMRALINPVTTMRGPTE